MGLDATEMEAVGELVNAAFLTAFSNTSPSSHAKILKFTYEMLRREVPYTLFSGQDTGTTRLSSLMFDDPVVRDFILLMTMHIFAKFGNTRERYEALVENLAEAIGLVDLPEVKDQRKAPERILPEVLDGLLPTASDVMDVLLWNRWAVTLALMMLYLMTPDDLNVLLTEKRAREQAAQAAEQAAQRRQALQQGRATTPAAS